MAKEITTSIHIAASKESIWKVLSDFENYPKWNPFIRFIQGTQKVGNTLTIHIVPPGKKGMKFKPSILEFEENKTFAWLGHLFVPGLFDGEHRFELIEKNDGTCNFIQSEKFKGLLVPFLKKMLEKNTRQGFQLMNEKLKEICERS